MKNVSSLKPSSRIDSPKTPGGISKSLLTPCRRVGLSRNWRKNGPSPFVSPLPGTPSSTEVKIEKSDEVMSKRETRKRKERCDQEELNDNLSTPVSNNKSDDVQDHDYVVSTPIADKSDILESTPSRHVVNPRRKKSKILLPSLTENKEIVDVESTKASVSIEDREIAEKFHDSSKINNKNEPCLENNVKTPMKTKSKSKDSSIKLTIKIGGEGGGKNNSVTDTDPAKSENGNENTKQKSPANLTKECIVVIQKKIYKKDLEKLKKAKDEMESKKQNIVNPVSQALFDSDSDDVPLSAINNKVAKTKSKLPTLDEDDDFEQSKSVKVKNLEDKTTSTSSLKGEPAKKKVKQKEISSNKSRIKNVEPKELKSTLPSSLDDDEDFVMDNKKTILIRKSYEKVTKPLKAKSTGSITQKDIDELKARIEIKKKLLMAKAVTEDTEELRDLIKKWQKGCQDALMELMELMKHKFPDKQNMEYSEILQTLKIPASLVGYDEENDCFGTPTDENIILSKFNDS